MANRKMTNAERRAANKRVNEITALIAAERKKGVTPENEARLRELEALLVEAQGNTSDARKAWEKIKQLGGKILPAIGATGGAVAGGVIGGPAGAAIGATTGGAIGAGITQLGKEKNEFLSGTSAKPDELKRYPAYTPEQMKIIEQLGPQGLAMLMQEQDFGPLQNQLSQLIAQNLQQPNEQTYAPYRSQLNELLTRNLQQPNEEALAPYQQELQKQLGYNRENRFNFEPIAARARQQFAEQTLPSIFERFTSMGKGAQTTGAFQGSLERGGAELNRGLAALESEYALKNRPLDLQQQQLLQSLLGQQQGYGLGKSQLYNQQQELLQRLLGQEQGYGIQKGQLGNQQQQLLQGLLGQQQGYGLAKKGLGLDILNKGLTSPYNDVLQQGQASTPGFWQSLIPHIISAGGQAAGAYYGAKA